MKISTNKVKSMRSKLAATILLLFFLSTSSFSQTTIPTPATGDYESAATGNWASASSWTIVGGGTVPATGPVAGKNVFIKAGHIITLTSTATPSAVTYSCANLYITATGSLISDGLANNALVLGKAIAAGTTTASLINNGRIGSGTSSLVPVANDDKLEIQVFTTYSTGNPTTTANFPATSVFTISGTGNTKILGLAATGAFFSSTDFAKTLTINIEQPLVLTGNGGRTLTLCRLSGNSVNENYIMNINKPVAVCAGSGSFNMNTSTTVAGGTYTYNINDELDFSLSTGTCGVIPLPQPSAGITNTATGKPNIITVNIANTWKIGSAAFSTFNGGTATNYSNAAINILDGGLLDGTKNTTFVSFGNMTNTYFNISGPNRTGKLKRTLANSAINDYVFPIGTPAGYSPVIIRNTGIIGDFTVGVVDNFTGFSTFTPPITTAYTLKNRFTVVAANAGSEIGLMKFGWQANDEGTSFDRTKDLSLQKYGTSSWDADANVNTSTVSGTGTPATTQNQNATTPVAADPYLVTLNPVPGPPAGVIALTANYTISQSPSTLPLNLLSFTGKLNDFSNEVELKWTTTSEVNTKNFEVLESTDGKSFNMVGTVSAKNTSGIHNYGFNTKSNKSGVLYFQLKQIDLDGKFQLSNVIDIKNKGGLLSVYPNPAQKYIVVNIPQANGVGNLSIYSQDGKLFYNKAIEENESSSNVNIESLNAGVYFLIINKGKEVSYQKFVKQ